MVFSRSLFSPIYRNRGIDFTLVAYSRSFCQTHLKGGNLILSPPGQVREFDHLVKKRGRIPEIDILFLSADYEFSLDKFALKGGKV